MAPFVFNYKTGQYDDLGKPTAKSDTYTTKIPSTGYPTYGLTGKEQTQTQQEGSDTLDTGTGTSNSLMDWYNKISPEVEKYVQDLLDFAKDDADFAAKWIEKEYKKATGTNDDTRKAFLNSVANTLEEKVGRIQFDYDTGKYRLQAGTDLALKRLAEDEQVTMDEYNTQNQLEREQQNSNLNARGIIQGTREGATGLAGKDVGNLETNITRRMDALKRSVGRSKDDITRENKYGLEDLATSARRNMLDTQDKYAYDLDQAERERKRRELEASYLKKDKLDTLKNAITGNSQYFS